MPSIYCPITGIFQYHIGHNVLTNATLNIFFKSVTIIDDDDDDDDEEYEYDVDDC